MGLTATLSWKILTAHNVLLCGLSPLLCVDIEQNRKLFQCPVHIKNTTIIIVFSKKYIFGNTACANK